MKTIQIRVSEDFAKELLRRLAGIINKGMAEKERVLLEMSMRSGRDEVAKLFGVHKPASVREKEKAEDEDFKDDCEFLDMLITLHKATNEGVKSQAPDTCHNIVPDNPDVANVNKGELYIKFDKVKPLLHQIAIGDFETKDGMHSLKMNVAYHSILDTVEDYWQPPVGSVPARNYRVSELPIPHCTTWVHEQATRAGKTLKANVYFIEEYNKMSSELHNIKQCYNKLAKLYNSLVEAVDRAGGPLKFNKEAQEKLAQYDVECKKNAELVEKLRDANSRIYHGDKRVTALENEIARHKERRTIEKAASYEHLYKASRILIEALASNNVLESGQFKDVYNLIYNK